MSLPARQARPRVLRWGSRALVAAGVAGVAWGVVAWNRPVKPSMAGLGLVEARRADLLATLRLGGETHSVNRTLIECQLERVEMRSEGRSSMSGGASTVLWVVDDGSMVKKGDLLCSLDASEYEELVRQQEIKVERVKTDLIAAELALETAELSVVQFRDGIVKEAVEEYEGKLSLAEADVARTKDRLAWTIKMRQKGYSSLGQLASETQAVAKAEQAVLKARWTLNLFREYGGPLETQTLAATAEKAKSNLIAVRLRSIQTFERLDYYKKMVEACSIKAPHDGFVIYAEANPWRGEGRVEAGQNVRQLQDLFEICDLSKMRIEGLLHESIVNRVKPGMKVHARIEGMANREVEGKVVKLDQLPDPDAGWLSDTKSFKVYIQLDNPPSDIRPEMTAEVVIDVGHRDNVVAIPAGALEIVDGREVCYVATEGRIERRPVRVGQTSRELLEVVEGLQEGEEVVDDLAELAAYAPLIVDGPALADSPPTPIGGSTDRPSLVSGPSMKPGAAAPAGL